MPAWHNATFHLTRAAALYAAILDRIEDSGYAVFAQRAVVPQRRRLRLAAYAALST